MYKYVFHIPSTHLRFAMYLKMLDVVYSPFFMQKN